MKAKDLFASFAKNAGLDKNTEILAMLEQDIFSEELPEHLGNMLLAGNMSEEAAKNNEKVKKHYQDIEKKHYFNIYDGELKKNLVDAGVSEEDLKEVMSIQSAYGDKMKKAFEVAKNTYSKGKTDAGKDDERIKTINELSAKLKTKEEDINNNYVKKELWDNLQKAIQTDKLNRVLGSKVAKIQIASAFENDKEAINEIILNKISKKYLIELGDNEQIKLKNLSDPSLDATDENKALLSFEDALAKEALQYTQKTPEQQKNIVTHVVDNTLQSGREKNQRDAEEMEKKYADYLK